MSARLFVCLCVAIAVAAGTPAQIAWQDAPYYNELEDIEKRYTPELRDELQSAKDDALLLYTEYTARSGADLKIFLQRLPSFGNETIGEIDLKSFQSAPSTCREVLRKRLKKIEHDAHLSASFSAENHHKYFLGHMIVFRIHLNKTEDYLRKCDLVTKNCGVPCETMPRVIRWRKLAAEEINRVREDIIHSRKSYRDLLAHSKRRLHRIKRNASSQAKLAVLTFQECVNSA